MHCLWFNIGNVSDKEYDCKFKQCVVKSRFIDFCAATIAMCYVYFLHYCLNVNKSLVDFPRIVSLRMLRVYSWFLTLFPYVQISAIPHQYIWSNNILYHLLRIEDHNNESSTNDSSVNNCFVAHITECLVFKTTTVIYFYFFSIRF